MPLPNVRALLILGSAGLVAGGASIPQPPAATKVLGLFSKLQAAQQTREHVAFSLSEAEINEYSVYALAVTPRPGLKSFSIKVFDQNYLSTLTVIDFDAVERWKPGTIPTLLKPVLSGQKTIWLDVRFHAEKGQTTFTVEKAYFQSLRLPAFFVNQLIKTVAARQPEHYDTSKPVPLPFGLQKIWTKGNVVWGEN